MLPAASNSHSGQAYSGGPAYMTEEREKAQAGLRMIEEAVVQLILEKGPMQPVPVSDALGLSWRLSSGGESGSIVYEIMRAMAEAGRLAKDGGSHPAYRVNTGSTR